MTRIVLENNGKIVVLAIVDGRSRFNPLLENGGPMGKTCVEAATNLAAYAPTSDPDGWGTERKSRGLPTEEFKEVARKQVDVARRLASGHPTDQLTNLALDLLAEVRDLRLGQSISDVGPQIRGIMSQIEHELEVA